MDLDDIILWILILICLIIVVIVLIASYRILFANDYAAEEIYNLDTNSIATGDILGVGYKNFFGWFVSGWSYSIWSHTGIAWRDPETNLLYVIEAARYKPPYRDLFKIPFELWIKINRKSRLCIVKYTGTKKICPLVMDEVFEKFNYFKLDKFSYKWKRFLVKTPYTEENRMHYTCYEMTIKILQECEIIDKKYVCSSYFASNVINGNIEWADGCSYSKPFAFSYDNFKKYINV